MVLVVDMALVVIVDRAADDPLSTGEVIRFLDDDEDEDDDKNDGGGGRKVVGMVGLVLGLDFLSFDSLFIL